MARRRLADIQIMKRLGEEGANSHGELMKIVTYNAYDDIIVQFQDAYKTEVKTSYKHFKEGSVKNNRPRLNEERLNNQGCLMRIVEYNAYDDIVVEFQDTNRAKVHSSYQAFCNGEVKNPYYPAVYGVGMVGNKCPIREDEKQTKEYCAWKHMLARCFDKRYKEKHSTYQDVACCDEWLLYENFYAWLHEQSNFNKWQNGKLWAIDKDILVKGNKVYSPDTCCLVPMNVNGLFAKKIRVCNNLPIGVYLTNKQHYQSYCHNPFTKKQECLGTYQTMEDAFYSGYKPYKESLIKQVAQIEYDAGNISKQCYDAMLNYQVEITD